MNLSNGRVWPYAIGASIIFIFGACVATIVVANTLPVEKSDTYMMGYHEADAKANEILEAAVEFNNNYKIEYISDKLDLQNSIIKYRVSDLDSNPVNDAEIKIVITRPNNHKYDQELNNPKVQNGIYSFDSIKLEQEGRWDVMAKVTIGKLQRFYNVKADTRESKIIEY
ncbi:MAG: FixH family protein [Sulfurimonas sp.]|uniref:FixH family protein n=1 Tax=Sulfurimonas sp. TaxID=2022749 RepID=UPI0025CBD7D2|nr:FixH family protein [Sulfurimonas sp.]MCK9454916.1 FixH family protein [Sulfurimonas sp.]